jgi:uncharacterized protein (UPF0332 family)
MDEVNKLIIKDEKNIELAEKLIEIGYFDVSISRIYYSFFYIAKALLLLKGLDFYKHSAVISFFNKEFIKEKIFDYKYFQIFNELFELRQESDYGLDEEFKKEDVAVYVEKAKEFLEEAKKYLGKRGAGEKVKSEELEVYNDEN